MTDTKAAQNSEKEQPKPEEPSKQKLVLMKKGDYSVHILLEEIKNCQQLDDKHLPYPTVKLTCFDKTQRTEKTDLPCESYIFDEHFYFEKTNLTVEQLDSSKIIIEAYDAEYSRKKSDYFGIYEFDLEYIYNQPEHALQNFWLALANPESDDMTKVRGFLKLSISVLHDNDPRVELVSKPNSTDCMVPSQIKMQYKMVSLHIYRAEELPDMDSLFSTKKVGRECDGFVEVKYLGLTRCTTVIPMKNEVIHWNEIIDIPVSIPTVSQKIVLTIKDHDSASKDDLVGSIEINVNDVINKNMYNELRYFDIYGSPFNDDSKYCTLMNNNAEIGSAWKGRILMKITTSDSDNPSASIRKMDESQITEAANISRSNLWSVYVKVYSAMYLPNKEDQYGIKIAMQDTNILCNPKRAINGNIEWKQFKTIQCQTLTNSLDELPDIFVYLCNSKGEHICFQRIKASEFHLNKDIMVIKLIPDPCYHKVDQLYKSGLVKLKICVTNKATDPPETRAILDGFKDGDSDKEETDDLEDLLNHSSGEIGIGGPLKATYAVVCNVYMTRYVVSSDSNGSNDPYVSLQCMETEISTGIKYNTVNGIWNEKLIFDNVEMDIKKRSTWPIFLLKLKDHDTLTGDDLLGYSYVWLSDMHFSFNKTDLVKPTWQQLYLPKSNRPQGEILLSFYIFDDANRSKVFEISATPETIPYSFEINILGLRDLKPLSLLPVKKSFIKFDMNSMNVTGEKEDSMQAIKTQPKDCGENPTINTVIKFDIKLPKEEIFMPELQCEVYDHLLSGMVNPLLGIFLLNVKQLIKKTHEQIDEDMKVTKKKVGLFLTRGLITKNLNSFAAGEKKSEGEIQKTKSKKKEIDHPLAPHEELIDTSVKQSDMEENAMNSESVNPNDIVLQIQPKKTNVALFKYDKQIIDENQYDSNYFVLLPQFRPYIIPGTKKGTPNYKEYRLEDESLIPGSDRYFAIGYISKQEKELNEDGKLIEKDLSKPENINKHYRRIFKKGLEHVKELELRSPFNVSFLRRGKDEDKEDETAIFAAISEKANKIVKRYTKEEINMTEEKKEEREVRRRKRREENGGVPPFLRNRGYGKFKGVIRICEKKKMDEYQKMISEYKANDPSMIQELKNLNKYEQLTRKILVKSKVVIRLYILELRDLAKKDLINESDPYVKIYLGNKLKFNEQKNHVDDQKTVQWYKHYDILSELPGESSLKIEVWDYDPIFRDELIGSTKIDLEDRFFNDKWKEMKYKPIEVRQLRHPDMSTLQGNISLWVEIFEKKDKINIEPWNIAPEPDTIVEMRLVIWETENMKCMDVEGTSDIYVTAYLDQKKKQSTDVHYRSQNGIGSFNWRIVIPITLPKDRKMLTLQVYDNDIFTSDDFICGGEIDLSSILKIPKDLDVPITFNKKYVDDVDIIEKDKYKNIEFMTKSDDETETKFWVQCYKNNQKEGRVLCSLEFLPQWKAEISKVGLGRSEPNVAPYLPPPVGRFEFSLNPFKMLNQCVGPRYRRKIYCGICMVCLVIYLACIIPYIILYLSGEVVNPFNW